MYSICELLCAVFLRQCPEFSAKVVINCSRRKGYVLQTYVTMDCPHIVTVYKFVVSCNLTSFVYSLSERMQFSSDPEPTG